MNLDAYPELMTTQHMAEVFSAAKHTIESLRSQGIFPIPHCYPFNNRIVRYKKSEVIAYLDGCHSRTYSDRLV